MSLCDWWIRSRKFPALTEENHFITSDPSEEYNCIAYAAGDVTRWWWPDPSDQAYWPPGIPKVATINSFVLAYQTIGYSMPSDGSLEPGVDKVALFVKGRSIPTHAARQLTDGRWTSKLGPSHDIAHELNALDGFAYGNIILFMRRGRSPVTPMALSPSEIQRLDQYYREGGLQAMASPHVHYDDSACPRAGCGRPMEWIDFKLGIGGGPDGLHQPLVQAWWDGTGFVGHCPSCEGWVHFTTLRMSALDDEAAGRLPQLPANWAIVAQFA